MVFERLFGGAGTPEQRLARMQREPQHPRSASTRRASACRRGLGAARPRAAAATISTTCAKSSAASRTPRSRPTRTPIALDAPVGVPEAFEEHVGADVRPAGGGVPGRHHARLHVHDGARRQAGRTRRSACPSRTTPCRTATGAATIRPSRRSSRRSTPITCRCSPSSSTKLANTPDGDGSLLDHSLILYGSGMSNANDHTHHPLPIAARRRRQREVDEARPSCLVAGRDDGEPLLTVAQRAGANLTSFGRSTRTLDI